MYILAWVVVVTTSLLFLMSFYYNNYTDKGRLETIIRPSEIQPLYKLAWFIGITYLFYYYFGL